MLVRWFPQRAAVGKLLVQKKLSIDTMEEKAMTTAVTHHEQRNPSEATLFVPLN